MQRKVLVQFQRERSNFQGDIVNQIFDVAGAIVTVALVFVVVSNGNSAAVINAIGNSFAHSIAAAQGRAA